MMHGTIVVTIGDVIEPLGLGVGATPNNRVVVGIAGLGRRGIRSKRRGQRTEYEAHSRQAGKLEDELSGNHGVLRKCYYRLSCARVHFKREPPHVYTLKLDKAG